MLLPDDIPGEPSSGPAAVLLLAVIQGLAEFLPISSSGHLVLARMAMELREAGLSLDVALHVGTLAAVAWAYRRDVGSLLGDLVGGRLRMWLWLVVATLPIAVIGILIKDWIEAAAQTTTVAGIGFLVTASLLLVGEARRRANESNGVADDADAEPAANYGNPSFGHALVLGFAQTLAILPGISRSGTTIATGLMLGLPARQAARLSFLMSLPAVAGAAIVQLPGAFEEGFGDISRGLVIGAMVLSGIVGWAALRTLLLVLARGAFKWFAAYCALLGVLALVFV
ncbi:MAG: undecaprenyl-diphosphate phosphatase [bacterium]|nr:undecaprenyl-diphosphate phosphatase [bacterium]